MVVKQDESSVSDQNEQINAAQASSAAARPRPRGRARTAMLAAAALLVGGCVVGGCVVGPNYKEPDVAVPDGYAGAHDAPSTQPTTRVTSSTQPAPTPRQAWWTTFNDPALDALVEQAAASNLDLRAAEARVREARAARGVVSADWWPDVAGGASYTRSKGSESFGP